MLNRLIHLIAGGACWAMRKRLQLALLFGLYDEKKYLTAIRGKNPDLSFYMFHIIVREFGLSKAIVLAERAVEIRIMEDCPEIVLRNTENLTRPKWYNASMAGRA